MAAGEFIKKGVKASSGATRPAEDEALAIIDPTGDGTTVTLPSSSNVVPPRFSTSSTENAFIADAMKRYLVNNFGINAELAGSYINYWADLNQTADGQYPTGIDDAFNVGALSLLPTANLPEFFTRNGTLYGTRNPRTGERYSVPVPIDPSDMMTPNLILNQRFGGSNFDNMAANAPELSDEMLMGMLQQPRGGGGGGRRGPVFDKDALKESVNEAYRFYLMDEATDPAGVADQFVTEATAFAAKGGNLDFQTWILNNIRSTARYKSLYRRKPPELSEDEFINQYRGVAQQFGTPTSITTANIESGLRSGASVAGFSERVQNSRPVQVASGNFGRQVANMMNQLRVMK